MRKIKISKNTKNALFVFVIAFSAFFAFEPLFEHLGQKAAQEFAAAIFGTIFAAVITMVLLSKQSETEEEKSRSEKVFEEKLDLYNQAISALQNIFKRTDSQNQVQMERAEIVELEFILAKLIMVADEKTIHEFRLIYRNISKNYSPDTGLLRITSTDKHMVFQFSDCCRQELGLSSKSIEKEILEDIVLDGELFLYLKQCDNYDSDLTETLKDIYGYLVFDLSTPLSQIDFEEDGFKVYRNEKRDKVFFQCHINNAELSVVIPGVVLVHKMKHFKYDNQNTVHIQSGERIKFLEDFGVLQKDIRLNKLK